MNWRKWKIGVGVALLLSLFTAGAGLVAGMKWQAFVAVFCAACLTHFLAFLKDHPIDSISFETDRLTKTAAGDVITEHRQTTVSKQPEPEPDKP